MEDSQEYKKKIKDNLEKTANLFKGDITINSLLESVAEGVVIINDDNQILLINSRLSEMTGYDKNKIIGESLDVLLPKNFRNIHQRHVNNFFKEPRKRPMGKGLDLVAKRKDDSVFPVEISLSFMDTEFGKIGIAFLTDISIRKKAVDELKQKNKELDAYAHTVAHDLNSYLNSMVGFSELLIDQDYDIDNETRRSYLKLIAESGRNMSNVINELLIFATMDKEEVRHRKVDVKQSIDNALKRVKTQIKENSAKINIKENIVNCIGYSPWIEEVWLNFISNAIKYGGSPPEIDVGFEKTNSDIIRYYVKDNGCGLTKEHIEVVFGENNKIKDKHTKGIGLGLSIVKRIIEKLGGDLSVESSDESGTVFSFFLKEFVE